MRLTSAYEGAGRLFGTITVNSVCSSCPDDERRSDAGRA